MITMDQNEVWDYLNTSLELHILPASWVIYQFRTVENETGHWGNKNKSYFWFRDHWGVKSTPKGTLVVWLVCHSNSKLTFHFLVTIICLSSLTVLSPSKDTNIYPRHMIATRKLDLGTFGGSNYPQKIDFSCMASLSQQQHVGCSLFSNNHMPK